MIDKLFGVQLHTKLKCEETGEEYAVGCRHAVLAQKSYAGAWVSAAGFICVCRWQLFRRPYSLWVCCLA